MMHFHILQMNTILINIQLFIKISHGEVTAKTLENVISTARELNIKVIFSEETVNTKTSEIIANEIGGKVLVLSPLKLYLMKLYF